MYNHFYDKTAQVERTQNDLPHWHQEGKLYFVTYRLGDSLPQSVLRDFRIEKAQWLEDHPLPWTEEITTEYHKRFSTSIDKWLDANYGSCILRQPAIAAIVDANLRHNDRVKYKLHSFVIMPNHVHVLVELFEGNQIQKIMHSWKSYSANQINKVLNRTGNVWWHEYFDRIVRDIVHYNNIKNYIVKNIQKGGVKWLT